MKIIIQMDHPLDKFYTRMITSEEKGTITHTLEEADIAVVDRYINVADIREKHPSILILYLYIHVDDRGKWNHLDNIYPVPSRNSSEVMELLERIGS